MSELDYEVYIARYDGEVMYVGEGKKGRHSHITSGISHVYLANQFHFSGKKLEVEVLPLDSKEFAKEKEDRLISELNPRWNRGYGNAEFVRLRSNIKNRIKSYRFPVKNTFQKDFLLWLSGMVDEDGSVELDVRFINNYLSSLEGFSSGFISRLASKDKEYYPKVKDVLKVEATSRNMYKFTFKELQK